MKPEYSLILPQLSEHKRATITILGGGGLDFFLEINILWGENG